MHWYINYTNWWCSCEVDKSKLSEQPDVKGCSGSNHFLVICHIPSPNKNPENASELNKNLKDNLYNSSWNLCLF